MDDRLDMGQTKKSTYTSHKFLPMIINFLYFSFSVFGECGLKCKESFFWRVIRFKKVFLYRTAKPFFCLNHTYCTNVKVIMYHRVRNK